MVSRLTLLLLLYMLFLKNICSFFSLLKFAADFLLSLMKLYLCELVAENQESPMLNSWIVEVSRLAPTGLKGLLLETAIF